MSKRVITLGTWEGKPIEWIVLKKDDTKALAVSKGVICRSAFNSVRGNDAWITSSLRVYLNDVFYNSAFSDEEKKKILNTLNSDPNSTKDDIFCLSVTEVNGLMSIRERSSSEIWWTRSPHSGNKAKNVSTNGVISNNGYVDSEYGVRPALYIRL